MKIFIVKDGELSLATDEILTVKEFHVILKRDKTQGKQVAFKEFCYIYNICDRDSYPNRHGLNDKEAHLYSVDVSDLPVNYKVDEAMLAAINRYYQLRPSPLEKIAKEIRAAFNTSYRVIKALRNNIEKTLELEDLKPDDLQNVTSALERLLTLSDSIPKKMRSLKEVDDLIAEESQDYEKMRGGGEIDESMDPDAAIG